MSERNKDYEVGYKKPPKHTRFKKGRKAKSGDKLEGIAQGFAELIEQSLQKKLPVPLDGKTVSMDALGVMVRQQVRAAANGNLSAVASLLRLMRYAKKRNDLPRWISKTWGVENEGQGAPEAPETAGR